MDKYKVAVLVENGLAHSIFTEKDLNVLGSFAQYNDIDALPQTISIEYMREHLASAQACITCWRTPSFTDELLDGAPDLRFIAHAAGAVRSLVPASFWNSGRHITSNAPLIAEDVAQTVLALLLSSLKQIWRFAKDTSSGQWDGGEAGTFQTKRLDGLNVGIIGCSHVGREVIKILKPFHCYINVWDPYLSAIEADMLGVTQLQLDDLIKSSDVFTLHAPANPDCRHLLNASNIPLIKDGALVINTARGMLIDEPPFIKELQKQRFQACLDVTDPEPPAADHPFRTLPNVLLTPHIAGGHTANGHQMMGRSAIKAIFNYLVRGLIDYEVRGEMLDHMA